MSSDSLYEYRLKEYHTPTPTLPLIASILTVQQRLLDIQKEGYSQLCAETAPSASLSAASSVLLLAVIGLFLDLILHDLFSMPVLTSSVPLNKGTLSHRRVKRTLLSSLTLL